MGNPSSHTNGKINTRQFRPVPSTTNHPRTRKPSSLDEKGEGLEPEPGMDFGANLPSELTKK
jgi:hypothetical protein